MLQKYQTVVFPADGLIKNQRCQNSLIVNLKERELLWRKKVPELSSREFPWGKKCPEFTKDRHKKMGLALAERKSGRFSMEG